MKDDDILQTLLGIGVAVLALSLIAFFVGPGVFKT